MLGLMGFSGSLPLYVIHRYYIFVFIDRANKDACLLIATADLGRIRGHLHDHAFCSHLCQLHYLDDSSPPLRNKTMESCYAVEKELEKLLSKFSYIDKHTANSLQELLTYVDGVKRELIEGQLFSFLYY